jgi:hypothetical protein
MTHDSGRAQSRTTAPTRIPYRVPHTHCWNASTRFLRAFYASYFSFSALISFLDAEDEDETSVSF